MKRTLKDYFVVTAKGIAMGAADVIPGVSGGTIAFISGIYEEFIDALKSFNFSLIRKLKNEGLLETWKHINGNFLLALFSGILISIVSLAKLIGYLLLHHAEILWSFFFGLILASTYFIGKKIGQWNLYPVFFLLVGIIIAYYITVAAPTETPEHTWFITLSGAIAICAMILPGISGSFILLLLGKYAFILNAVSTLNIKVLISFAIGCVLGLISFSHVLSWMFRKYHDITMALLTGFMIGSLNKVWPWKNTLLWGTDHHGKQIALKQTSVLPGYYENEPHLLYCILFAVLGLAVIILLEKQSNNNTPIQK
ncbi:MAG: DUF368 domain-containing protein [Flavobacteriales bacterium]|nr:DUF368 domain-containing protein [Flavobacteriales bacterium]